MPLYLATFPPGRDGNAELRLLVDVEVRGRVAVLLQLPVGLGNPAVVFVHHAQHLHRFGQKRIPVIVDEGEILRIGPPVKSAGVGNLDPLLLVFVELDGGVPQKIVPVDDGVHQKLAQRPGGIPGYGILPHRGGQNGTAGRGAGFDKHVQLLDHPHEWPAESVLLKHLSGIVRPVELDVLHVSRRNEAFRMLRKQKNAKVRRTILFRAEEPQGPHLLDDRPVVVLDDLGVDGLWQIEGAEKRKVQIGHFRAFAGQLLVPRPEARPPFREDAHVLLPGLALPRPHPNPDIAVVADGRIGRRKNLDDDDVAFHQGKLLHGHRRRRQKISVGL